MINQTKKILNLATVQGMGEIKKWTKNRFTKSLLASNCLDSK